MKNIVLRGHIEVNEEDPNILNNPASWFYRSYFAKRK